MPAQVHTVAPAREVLQTGIPRPSADRRDALAAVTATRAGRWLVPSLSDLVFVAFFIWLFVAGGDGWHGLLLDGDTGWHIRTGDWIIAHHAVPTTDLFSFTRPGAPWFAWEWLPDLLFAGLHWSWGLKGVVLISGVVIALWPVLLLRQALWRGANLWAALATTLLGVSAASIHFLARPHIFTLLFVTVSVWMIESDRRTPGWRVYLLLPLIVLWANTHGGFVILIALLGLTAAGSLGEAWATGGQLGRVRRYCVLTAGCGIASVLNPYGIRLLSHIVEYLRSDWIRDVIQEFKAPDFRSENQLQYEVLLIVGLMAAAFLASRRRFVEALWIVAFAHLSLQSLRHVPVYIAVIAPLLAQVLTEVGPAVSVGSDPRSALRILGRIGVELRPGFGRTSIWLVGFVLAYSVVGRAANWPNDFPTVHFPVAMIHQHRETIATGRVFTVDQWADYLIYLNYPRQRVFVDGRSDFFGPEVGGDYLRTVEGDYRWRSTLDRYGVDTVLAPVAWPLATILKRDAGWRTVADDGRTILFTRCAGGT